MLVSFSLLLSLRPFAFLLSLPSSSAYVGPASLTVTMLLVSIGDVASGSVSVFLLVGRV